MILGLDVSTSIIGVCLFKDDKVVKADYIDLRKISGLLHKAQAVEDYINNNLQEAQIEHIFIEQALMFFRRGGSTAKTMATLQNFNGVVSWLCFKLLELEHQYITPISARSKCGIK